LGAAGALGVAFVNNSPARTRNTSLRPASLCHVWPGASYRGARTETAPRWRRDGAKV